MGKNNELVKHEKNAAQDKGEVVDGARDMIRARVCASGLCVQGTLRTIHERTASGFEKLKHTFRDRVSGSSTDLQRSVFAAGRIHFVCVQYAKTALLPCKPTQLAPLLVKL